MAFCGNHIFSVSKRRWQHAYLIRMIIATSRGQNIGRTNYVVTCLFYPLLFGVRDYCFILLMEQNFNQLITETPICMQYGWSYAYNYLLKTCFNQISQSLSAFEKQLLLVMHFCTFSFVSLENVIFLTFFLNHHIFPFM